LARKDGLDKKSLHILHKHQRNNADAVDAIIVAIEARCWLNATSTPPLHVACRSGASMDVIRHLWVMYPGAAKRNFSGLTPLDVARTQRSHVQ
jgi:hypothetical protein